MWTHWSDSNFIPRISKKFEFRNLDFTIRFYMKKESRNRKNEVMWGHVTLYFLILRFETLTHNNVNTISANRKWTLKSSWEYWSILRSEFGWCRDYGIWRNYEKSIFWTWAILESLIRQVSTYAHVSNWNFNANSVRIKFFGFAYANY